MKIFMEDFLFYICCLIPLAIFIVVMIVLVKKHNEETRNLVSQLSEEQLNELKDNCVENYDNTRFTWYQKAIIAKFVEKGKNVNIKLLWYNTIIQNDTLYQCQHADLKMKKDEFVSRGLKVGDYVKVFIDPKKTTIKIV